MSFNRLPVETLQRIVDLCADADERYKARTNDPDDASDAERDEDDWRGRSCSAMSLVSTTLRHLACKHVFKTLSGLGVQADTFQLFVLGSSIELCVTKVVFDSSASFFHLVIQALPRLPNLRAVEGLSSAMLEANLRPLPLRDAPDETDPRKIRAREVLPSLVLRVPEWSIAMNENDFDTLIEVNPEGVTHLCLSSPRRFGFPILESSVSRFPSILSRCSSLVSLTVKHTESYPDDSDPALVSIAKSVLDVPFSFVNTLCSLNLDISRDNQDRGVLADLKFASRFPMLRRLTLNHEGREFSLRDNDTETFTFPSLKRLEVRNAELHACVELLESVELPRIVELHFAAVGATSFLHDEQLMWLGYMGSRLEVYDKTLSIFEITETSHLAVAFVEQLSDLLGRTVSVRLDSITRRSLVPDDCTLTTPTSSPPPSPRSLRRRATNRVNIKVKELLAWASARAASLKGRDFVGEQSLLKALEPIEEMKDWLED
ncbi:hypothetical protein JCM11491_006805 [Sporobolomyces phaffii]